jgi:O-antigen/teichoic acid export membrane protein
MRFIKIIASKFGIDKAIMFTSAANVLGAFGSVVSVILVVKYLTGIEQGFYYTFGSIVAIQVFFELGLNGIITQYVAHEVSNLKWESDQILYGDSKYMSRLSSLLHFSVKWYLCFATLLLISLIAVGSIFFNRYDTTNGAVSWVAPWILLTIGTGINLILSPVMAFLQGLGKVKEIAKIQLIQQIFRLSMVWGGLILGAKLYVMGMSSFIGVFLLVLIIAGKYRKILTNIWRVLIVEKVHYRTEIFPYQWKIAISWISGYFIFQLFNPVLFATEGAVVAGQMGMTLAAFNGILSLSYAWITTKVPLFSGLIAQQEYSHLDRIFNKTLKESVWVSFSALAFMTIVIFLIRFFNIEISGKPLGNRFLDYIPMFFMMIPVLLNLVVGSWATYLRCHKKEPFLINSIVGGISCSLSTVLLGKYFGVIGITSGYCLITISMFPWAYYIFKTKRLEWHTLLANDKTK